MPVELTPQRELTPSHINRAFEALGVGRIAGDQAKALRDLGIIARELGILETMQGTVLLSQQAITEMIAMLTQLTHVSDGSPKKPTKKLIEISKAVGYLSTQLARVNASAIKNEHVVVEARLEADKQRRSSFPAGRAVGPIIDVKP